MPNVFIGIAFKSRFKEILEMHHRKNFSKKFLFLPSKGDRSESVNQFLDKVSLPPVDCLCKDFRKYSPSNKDFNPADLDTQGNEREDAAKAMYASFKKIGKIYDGNLIRNVDYFLVKN